MKKAAFLLFLLSQSLLNSQAQSKITLFSKGEFQGLKNGSSEIIIPAKYKSLGWSEGLQIPVDDVIGYKKKLWGLISLDNKRITDAKYYNLWAFHKDLIIASIKGKFSNHIFYGAIDSKGRAVIEFKYSSVEKIGNNLIIAEKRKGQTYYGLLSEKNKMLLKVAYRQISHFENELFVFSNDKNKKGIIRSNGKILIEPTLDSISNPINGMAFIFNRGKQGIIDQSGKIVLESEHKSINQLDSNKFSTISFDQWSVINANNEVQKVFDADSVKLTESNSYLVYRNDHLEIFNNDFESIYTQRNASITSSQEDKLVLRQGGVYGVIDASGNAFIPFVNDSIYATDNYFFIKKMTKWTIWNKFGRKISRFKYDNAQPDSEGLIAVKRKGYWGFIDFQGDETIPLKFDDVAPFRDRIAKVSYLNSEGSVNQFGEWVCEPIYDRVEITKSGLSKGQVRRRIDLVGQTGNVLFQTYNHLTPHESGFLETTDDGLKGLVSTEGKIFLYPENEYVSKNLPGNKIFFKRGEYSGLISTTGDWEFYLSDRFEDCLGQNEDYYAVRIDGRYGFVDQMQRLRIANRYDSVSLFHEGKAAIKLRNKWGFIDKSEKIIIQPHYDEVSNFQNGLAKAKENKKYGVIDIKGNTVLPFDYDDIIKINIDYTLLKRDSKYGIMKSDGFVVVSAEYDYLHYSQGDLFIAKRRGKFGVMNNTGLFNIPLIYDKILSAEGGIYFCVKTGQAKEILLNP